MSAAEPWVLLAGGGSGGHIYPNIAVAERLAERGIGARYAVSDRPLDAKICQKQGLDFTTLRAAPLGVKPKALLGFACGFVRGQQQAAAMVNGGGCLAVIATGGFVSAPVARAAKRAGVPVGLVSLDAVPGKANRLAARWADTLFSTFETDRMPTAQRVGMPLRRASVLSSEVDADAAKRELGLPPDRQVLLVTAGSQGLSTTNRMMTALLAGQACGGQASTAEEVWAAEGDNAAAAVRSAFVADRISKSRDSGAVGGNATQLASSGSWHVLHLTGERDFSAVADGYAAAGVSATVLPFCGQMGHAWRAASLAVSLAGAGSVAEAWANAVPTVFFPYPYHQDQHQRLNAEPAVASGGALLLDDTIRATANAKRLAGPLARLIAEAGERDRMRAALKKSVPDDGAQVLADWAVGQKRGA